MAGSKTAVALGERDREMPGRLARMRTAQAQTAARARILLLRDGGTVGYEIPFTRHFYEYTPLRPSSEIMAEIRELETSIVEQLQKAGL